MAQKKAIGFLENIQLSITSVQMNKPVSKILRKELSHFKNNANKVILVICAMSVIELTIMEKLTQTNAPNAVNPPGDILLILGYFSYFHGLL